MFTKNQLFLKDNELHHAYLITGDVSENFNRLREVIAKIVGVEVESYPDYRSYFVSSFTVDHSRGLIEDQKTRSFSPDGAAGAGGGRRFFVIAAHSYTSEAQNGLLRVLEDPIAGNHFFLIAADADILLPTLRSRLMHLEGESSARSDIGLWCQRFLKSSVSGRMLMIEKFLEEDEDDLKTTKQRTSDILNQIEGIIALRLADKRNSADASLLGELMKVKVYLNDTAPAPRLILEYLAFIC